MPTSRSSRSAGPELTTTYGDLATGYIVTPTLPEGHEPTKRPKRPEREPDQPMVGADLVQRAVQTYAAQHPRLTSVTDRYVSLVTTLLDDAGINYLSVGGRAKSVGVVRGQGRSHPGRACRCSPTR